MRISFIGAGRVAHHLAEALHSRQHQIVNIYSRSSSGQPLALVCNAKAVTKMSDLDADIDLLIIAVSDNAISSVIREVNAYLPDTLIVHTSGSTSLEKLSCVHKRAGVFYPLQTFSFEREIDWSAAPLFIEAVQDEDLQLLSELAHQLSSRVYSYSSEQRLSLHLAAVFACNFSNYCYDMAKQLVDEQQVDFSLLYPLMLETAKKALSAEPKQVQTGPAMRGDENIIAMHQGMLQQTGRADLQQVYALLSEQIIRRHQN